MTNGEYAFGDRRAFLKAVGVVGAGGALTGLLAACGSDDKGPTTSNPTAGTSGAGGGSGSTMKIDFQLDFLPLGRYAPYYYAIKQGFYRDAGFDVTLHHTTSTAAAIQQLAAGKAQIGLNSLPSMFKLAAQDPTAHMKSYAVIYAKASETIFFFKDGPIKQPKDLEGQTIATSAGSNEYNNFPAFAAATGIDASKVKWKVVDPNAKTGLLLQGAVPATSTNYIGLAGLQAGAKPGQQIGYFLYGDYGVKEYGTCVITTNAWADANKDRIKPFVEATLKGFTEAFKDPEAAAAAMVEKVPTLKQASAVAEVKLLPDLVMGPEQKTHGIGYQDPATVKDNYDEAVTLTKKSIPQPYTEYFTNDYL